VSATNTVGNAMAFSGGLQVDLPVDFAITDSIIARNGVSAATLRNSTGLAHADSGGMFLFGSIAHSRVDGNLVRAASAHGDTEAFAGGMWVLRALSV
jgi:hypothetical protein